MKKLCLFVATILFNIHLFAQAGANFGIKAGLNIANLNIENSNYNDFTTDSRIGFHTGLLAHVHLTPEWALQPEVVYSQEGAKLKFNLSGQDVEVKTKLDYINIPVAIQYMFHNGFRIEAVPQLGVMINSKYEDDDGTEDDADDDFKSTNFSVGPGIGYLTYSGFGVGARYMFGISKIGEGSSDVRGNTFSLSLFYMLNSRHKAQSR
ncbi:MAG: PorT family protein [Chitinophagaceae bacterium]|nr:PorT family protein [Chitinophagaceae bacterium]